MVLLSRHTARHGNLASMIMQEDSELRKQDDVPLRCLRLSLNKTRGLGLGPAGELRTYMDDAGV